MPGELGPISGLGRSPGGGGHSNTLQHSCLEKPQEQRSTASYSSWGSQRVGRAERLRQKASVTIKSKLPTMDNKTQSLPASLAFSLSTEFLTLKDVAILNFFQLP